MTYEEVLSRFTVKSQSRDKAQCICPAHNDKEASLTISRGEKGTVVHCHAGCETSEVLGAVGLTVKDLFDDGGQIRTGLKWKSYVEGREKRQIEDVYHYIDLSGQYAFTRLRMTGKEFIYGIMDGDHFTYGLNGKHRKDLPAVFCESLEAVKTAIKNGQRIFYCEGEKDVKTVNFRGLTGITCGASGDWVPECAALFEGADVVILQDNDKSGEKLTKTVSKDLRKVVKSLRVIVPTPDLEHGDISDFFKDHTVDDLEELLLQEVQEVEEDLQEEQEVEEDPEDIDQFHLKNEQGKITGVFDYAIFQYLKNEKNLFVLGGVPYIYKDGVFKPDLSGAELKTMIRGLIYPQFVKAPTIKRIFDLFISDAELQVIAEDLNRYPVEWINFKNGFYDPRTRQMIPHDPEYRATNQIPFEFNPGGQLLGDTVLEWLYDICEDRTEDIEMLCEFSGLCLTRDTRQQKFMILNGDGGTGKSTVIRMIETMIGTENVSNISLNQLTQRFAPFGLMGKLLNSCADLEIDALSDVSTLKKVLGEDSISAEAKGKDAVNFKSYAKLIFSTNQLPIVKAEQTNGFYRRLLILTMNRIPEKPDPDFFDRLSAEISDFILLSVDALSRMYEHGRITESAGSIEAVKRLRNDSDTVEAFLNEKTVRIPEGRIKKSDLFREYEEFCRNLERQPHTKQNFFRSMRVKGYGEIKTIGVECFRGIESREKLPKKSHEKSPNEWKEVPSNETPFD